MPVTKETVRAVNRLGARWAGALGESPGNTVCSALGVWPLLALLADGAHGPARAELAEGVGLPAGEAASAARELLAGLRAMRGLDSALGLWTKRTLELREAWEAGLPVGAHGVLTGDEDTDRGALDAWAARHTGGLVEAMPVVLEKDTELVLASALALRTRWPRPFDDFPLRVGHGPWQGRTLLGLGRRSTLLDRVGVADTPHGLVTGLTVHGGNGIDVRLLLGEEGMTPGQVLAAGVGIVAGRHPVLPGPRLPLGEVGPGLRVVRELSRTPDPPVLDVTTVAYDVAASHDLLALHEVFGLTAARDDSVGHFSGISGSLPLAVNSARQAAVARFDAEGFQAAAVSSFGVAGAGAVPRLRWRTTRVEAAFERPFGFLAVHRHSRVVLAVGWVAEPSPFSWG
ncbi:MULTISPECIES: serpin family protein [Streptomyces]|uniref:Proteinase inhibitor I4 serpin n=2 Tax=Streptomyces TaxID=1883 RepID=A0A2U9P850_STRAS|nr:serpin family protein [Streptomyces actuosus]AWT45275.1 proteinase inhibitor I4 serpin [Streptomyces actuosus]MBM4821870.1 proteinase inhibitor I4 serpin [Streptomyces actuosus]